MRFISFLSAHQGQRGSRSSRFRHTHAANLNSLKFCPKRMKVKKKVAKFDAHEPTEFIFDSDVCCLVRNERHYLHPCLPSPVCSSETKITFLKYNCHITKISLDRSHRTYSFNLHHPIFNVSIPCRKHDKIASANDFRQSTVFADVVLLRIVKKNMNSFLFI